MNSSGEPETEQKKRLYVEPKSALQAIVMLAGILPETSRALCRRKWKVQLVSGTSASAKIARPGQYQA